MSIDWLLIGLIVLIHLSVEVLSDGSSDIIEPNTTVADNAETNADNNVTENWITLPEEEMAILLPDRNSSPILELKDHFDNIKNTSSEKSIFDRQISHKYPQTRVVAHMELEAVFHCNQQSAMTTVSFRHNLDNYFVCNQVLDLAHDLKLNATLKKRFAKMTRNYVPQTLVSRDLSVQLVFFKGNQIYHGSGRVDNGYCTGDRLSILSVGLAKKGGCKSRSGVQQIVSEWAVLSLSGKCQTQCFGDINIVFSPGLRN